MSEPSNTPANDTDTVAGVVDQDFLEEWAWRLFLDAWAAGEDHERTGDPIDRLRAQDATARRRSLLARLTPEGRARHDAAILAFYGLGLDLAQGAA